MNKTLKANSGSKTFLTEAVRYNKKLSSTQKIILAEISGLCRKQGRCWATNNYFAQKFFLSSRTISRCISNLQDQGLIFIQIDKANGNKRLIFLCDDSAKLSTPVDKDDECYRQKSPQIGEPHLIYIKNNKINKVLEEHSRPNLNVENFSSFRKEGNSPMLNQIEHYMISLENDWLNGQEMEEAKAFFDHYAARGWKLNGSPMVDWQAAVRSWLNKSLNFNKNINAHKSPDQSSYSSDFNRNKCRQTENGKYSESF